MKRTNKNGKPAKNRKIPLRPAARNPNVLSKRTAERATDKLVALAEAAQKRAYAPYSNFHVGTALLTDAGVHTAANVENASYGLSICAERNAISRAVLDGARAILAVAVVTDTSPPAAPCGMCLQTLAEFAPDFDALRVTLANPAGERRDHTLADLLPHGFRPRDLLRR